MNNPYLPYLAEITAARDLASGIKLFRCRFVEETPPAFHYAPGQFGFLSAFGVGEAPFGLAVSEARSHGQVEFAVQRIGSVTNALHDMLPGDLVGVRGPMGILAAYHLHRLAPCAAPEALDVPILAAVVAARHVRQLRRMVPAGRVADAWRLGVGRGSWRDVSAWSSTHCAPSSLTTSSPCRSVTQNHRRAGTLSPVLLNSAAACMSSRSRA